jgi:hypothetical protein
VTDDEVVDAVRQVMWGKELPAPATEQAIAEAEAIIGYPLPPLLRRLYTEVANGGFGPDEGIVGVRGGRTYQGDLIDLAELYEAGPDPEGRIPAGVVPIYDWGGTGWSMVDFRDPAAPMWWNEDGDAWLQDQTLAEWLVQAAAGTWKAPHWSENPARRFDQSES